MSLGASAMAGGAMVGTVSATALGATMGGMMAGAAIGAAVGSIAGQGVAMAAGMQKEFNWNQVGLSALSAGLTAGIGSYFGPTTNAWELAGRAALSTGLSQGIGDQLGMGVKFSWTNVALAAVSSGMNSAMKMYSPFKANDLFNNSINGFASGMTMNALRGGKMTAAQVATDAFGNALAESIKDNMSKPSQQEDVLGDFIQEKLAAQQQREQSAAMHDLTRGDGGAPGMDGGMGITLGGGNGPGIRYGGLQARQLVEDEQLVANGGGGYYDDSDARITTPGNAEKLQADINAINERAQQKALVQSNAMARDDNDDGTELRRLALYSPDGQQREANRSSEETAGEVFAKEAFRAGLDNRYRRLAQSTGETDKPGKFAREIKDIIVSAGTGYENDAGAQVVAMYSEKLDALIQKGPGQSVFGSEHGDGFLDNSLVKLRLPEAAFWVNNRQRNETFHSYDLITNIGPSGPRVNLEYVQDGLLRNAYSYPGFKMGPVSNAMNGGDRLVFVTAPNEKWLNDPSTYVAPIGIIQQAAVPGGVLNITTEDHGVYKGTIRRTAFEYEGNIFIHTQGVGINKAFNMPDNPISRPIFKFAAVQNDSAGAMAFRALDQKIFQAAEARRTARN
jgi:hypothetical protein